MQSDWVVVLALGCKIVEKSIIDVVSIIVLSSFDIYLVRLFEC